jgi:hypothetical protein
MSDNNESADARPLGPFAPLIERTPLPVELGAMMDLPPIQGALGSIWLLLNDRRELCHSGVSRLLAEEWLSEPREAILLTIEDMRERGDPIADPAGIASALRFCVGAD